MLKLIPVFLVATALLLTSCKKEGCTIPEASNYSEKAKVDDGSCVYNGNILLWYDAETKSIMDLNNITSLTYTIDGVEIGTYTSDKDSEWAPECEAEGSIGRTLVYGTTEPRTITYSVVDNNGTERFSGSIGITPPDCVKKKLIW
jgi:hypothetical protein